MGDDRSTMSEVASSTPGGYPGSRDQGGPGGGRKCCRCCRSTPAATLPRRDGRCDGRDRWRSDMRGDFGLPRETCCRGKQATDEATEGYVQGTCRRCATPCGGRTAVEAIAGDFINACDAASGVANAPELGSYASRSCGSGSMCWRMGGASARAPRRWGVARGAPRSTMLRSLRRRAGDHTSGPALAQRPSLTTTNVQPARGESKLAAGLVSFPRFAQPRARHP